MTVYENYDVIAFKSCIQKFTVRWKWKVQKRPIKSLMVLVKKWLFSKYQKICLFILSQKYQNIASADCWPILVNPEINP